MSHIPSSRPTSGIPTRMWLAFAFSLYGCWYSLSRAITGIDSDGALIAWTINALALLLISRIWLAAHRRQLTPAAAPVTRTIGVGLFAVVAISLAIAILA